MRDKIIQILQGAFNPSQLEVIDESHKHQGHAGNTMSGESHFKITISAPSFRALSSLQAHRAVYEALGNLIEKIHAVSIEILRD